MTWLCFFFRTLKIEQAKVLSMCFFCVNKEAARGGYIASEATRKCYKILLFYASSWNLSFWYHDDCVILVGELKNIYIYIYWGFDCIDSAQFVEVSVCYWRIGLMVVWFTLKLATSSRGLFISIPYSWW